MVAVALKLEIGDHSDDGTDDGATYVCCVLPLIPYVRCESRQEAEATPKTMSFMHLHLGIEGALPPGTDVRGRGALCLNAFQHVDGGVSVGYALLGVRRCSVFSLCVFMC